MLHNDLASKYPDVPGKIISKKAKKLEEEASQNPWMTFARYQPERESVEEFKTGMGEALAGSTKPKPK